MIRYIKKVLIITSILILSLSIGVVSFANDQVSKEKVSEIIDIQQSNVTVSKVMSFDEIVNVLAKDKEISKEKASEQLSKNKPESFLSDTLRSLDTYRTVSYRFTVNAIYKPTMKFYAKTSESGTQWGFLEILNVQMDRDYYGTSKIFGGNVYTLSLTLI